MNKVEKQLSMIIDLKLWHMYPHMCKSTHMCTRARKHAHTHTKNEREKFLPQAPCTYCEEWLWWVSQPSVAWPEPLSPPLHRVQCLAVSPDCRRWHLSTCEVWGKRELVVCLEGWEGTVRRSRVAQCGDEWTIQNSAHWSSCLWFNVPTLWYSLQLYLSHKAVGIPWI